MIEQIIRAGGQGEKVKEQSLTLPVCVRTKDGLYRILASYTVINSEKASSSKCPKGSKECRRIPIGMNDLKEIKQAVTSHVLYSPFVKEMVKTWASSNKASPHNCLQLLSAVLENGSQVPWKSYW